MQQAPNPCMKKLQLSVSQTNKSTSSLMLSNRRCDSSGENKTSVHVQEKQIKEKTPHCSFSIFFFKGKIVKGNGLNVFP